MGKVSGNRVKYGKKKRALTPTAGYGSE